MAGVSPDVTAIPLGRPLPGASSNQPERQGQRMRPRLSPRASAHRSYSVLLPAGLAVPPTLPPARCALAAPFHPYPCDKALRPARRGGLLSVALSLGSPPPDVIRRRIRMEPGLSSACAAAVRPTGERGHRGAAWRRSRRKGRRRPPVSIDPAFIAASPGLWECAARGRLARFAASAAVRG